MTVILVSKVGIADVALAAGKRRWLLAGCTNVYASALTIKKMA